MTLRRRLLTLLTGRQHWYTNSGNSGIGTMATVDVKVKKIVAIAQMRTTNDKKANMAQVKELVKRAKSQAASFLFLPECCDFVSERRVEAIELSEPLTGTTMQNYKQLAKENAIWLALGGIHESILDQSQCKTDRVYNSHVIVDDCGNVISIYRKLHLFDVVTPEFHFQESRVIVPGSCLVPPLDTPIGKLGLQICYDVRFPEASLLLRKMGAEILTYPAAFAYATGKDHWEILLRARAIESQCFVLAPAQIGQHNAKRRSWGHAMAIDPWGRVLADCGCEQDLTLAIVNLDFCELAKNRKNMPCFEHRRSDIYNLSIIEMANTVDATADRMFANKIIQKETIFYESRHCFAFTNICCVVEGHVLVSTKRIIKRLHELNCEETADLFTTVCTVQKMLEAYYGTSSATVTVQDGKDAGQTVPHLHFHIMPRRPGDFAYNDRIYEKLEDHKDQKTPRSIGERADEAQKYRNQLRKSLLDI